MSSSFDRSDMLVRRCQRPEDRKPFAALSSAVPELVGFIPTPLAALAPPVLAIRTSRHAAPPVLEGVYLTESESSLGLQISNYSETLHDSSRGPIAQQGSADCKRIISNRELMSRASALTLMDHRFARVTAQRTRRSLR